MTRNDDPHGIRNGLAEEVAAVIKDMKKDRLSLEPTFSVSERIRALGPLIAYQARIMDKAPEEEPEHVGATVRKYEQLFEGKASAGGRAGDTRRSKRPLPVPIPNDPITESERSITPDDAA